MQNGKEQNTQCTSTSRISVIVPIYNGESTMERCLESLISQDVKSLEIIIVNDGSTDCSAQIAQEYAKTYSNVKFFSQENRGLCAARNLGLRNSTGKYIGFVDCDDWIAKDMFSHLLSAAQEFKADIVSCGYYRVKYGIDVTSVCDGVTRVFTAKEAVIELVTRRRMRSYFWNKLFVRRLWEKHEFPEGRTFEGTLLMHRILMDSDLVVLTGVPKYYYLDTEDSIVNDPSLNKLFAKMDAQVKRYNDLQHIQDIKAVLAQGITEVASVLRREIMHSSKKEIESSSYFSKIDLESWRRTFQDVKGDLELAPLLFGSLDALSRLSIRRLKFLYYLEKLLYRKKGRLGNALDDNSRKAQKKFSGSGNSEFAKKKLIKLQSVQAYILREMVSVCKQNNIEYFVYGGTLLGAIRHNGFIPWDDDIDVIMPRDSYERFLKVAGNEMPKGIFLQNCETDPEFPMMYSKLRLDDTFYFEGKWKNKGMHQGVFIDIMPLDRFPDSKLIGWISLRFHDFLHKAANNHSRASNLVTSGFLKVIKILPKRYIYKLRSIHLCLINQISRGRFCCSYGSHYKPLERRVFRSSWFKSGRFAEFHGMRVSIPSGTESYLEELYGSDYMSLPKSGARRVHTSIDKCNVGFVPFELAGEESRIESTDNRGMC